jgi:hypothetical protein
LILGSGEERPLEEHYYTESAIQLKKNKERKNWLLEAYGDVV